MTLNVTRTLVMLLTAIQLSCTLAAQETDAARNQDASPIPCGSHMSSRVDVVDSDSATPMTSDVGGVQSLCSPDEAYVVAWDSVNAEPGCSYLNQESKFAAFLKSLMSQGGEWAFSSRYAPAFTDTNCDGLWELRQVRLEDECGMLGREVEPVVVLGFDELIPEVNAICKDWFRPAGSFPLVVEVKNVKKSPVTENYLFYILAMEKGSTKLVTQIAIDATWHVAHSMKSNFTDIREGMSISMHLGLPSNIPTNYVRCDVSQILLHGAGESPGTPLELGLTGTLRRATIARFADPLTDCVNTK